jgi:hypothetical protein
VYWSLLFWRDISRKIALGQVNASSSIAMSFRRLQWRNTKYIQANGNNHWSIPWTIFALMQKQCRVRTDSPIISQRSEDSHAPWSVVYRESLQTLT